ncbi:coiled-coil domain-containing protein 15 isoform X4 [Ailuropoda melanoleuca]|uniref:coiled-coil domain-containing protein 15 isoform X4 n=1 Tax=Ailuropoda melanoleuca TaxID=9646 RepID=UPI0014947C30|nr:coiled-coil domain-containing protein 15 isoform X4 [Ailuropoda melanoleuca]
MPGSMAPLKKPRNTTRVPLALNPLKSKDVLAVLAERNQAIMPVGAWVEPALPDSSEVPAYTSAYMIEEELKEQLRKKQEALKHFQRQVKHRVNQQIRLRKKQQFQRSYEAAEKEGAIAMQSSDPAHLTPKRTSVFPNNLDAAIGSARLPPSQMLGDGMDDRENQNELFQQQAQALSQTMKQARHRLASFKTVNKKNVSVFPDGRRKIFPPQEKALCRKPSSLKINTRSRGQLTFKEPDSEESSSIMIDKKGRENLIWGDQQDLLSEDRDKPFSKVQKVQFKNPLFAVMKEEEELDLQGLQNILPEAQNYLPEAQGDLIEVQSVELEAESVEPEAESVEPRLNTLAIELESQAVEPEAQATEPKAQAVKIKTQGIMPEAQIVELEDGSIVSEVQDLLPKTQCVLLKDRNILPRCQDQDFLLKDQDFPPKDQNILPECQDQHFLPRDQHVLPEDQNMQSKFQDQDFLPKDHHQCFLPRDQEANLKQPASILIGPRGRQAFPLDVHQDLLPRPQDQTSTRDKSKYINQPSSCEKWEIERMASGVPSSLYFRQQPSVGTAERWQEDLLLDDHQQLPAKPQREASSRRQVYDAYQSRLNTEFQTPLMLQSGVDQEEDKKERQKQYLRYRRLFMDIEREQVKEQQRQKEHQKKVEKIKKKKEQQRYAEEQRILRVNFHEELYSGEKMSDILAQLKLEELKGAREKQQQREKECQRYIEALRARIQEKMRLYNITLPPLCCCGTDFWDAHPDTCANNCIFYKNHRAYTRALRSVINSCDIPEGTSTVRVAMHNLASAHRRTLKNL